jgi:dTDP-4-amino-4,6-dideoxygalactose transaminase
MKIPSNRLFFAGRELTYVAQAIASGEISSDGPFTQKSSRLLEERFAIHKVLITPSCSAALEIAAMLCDLKSGDEVILPSFTFASTANAVVRLGAKPVFVDIRPDTLNLDERLVERVITSRTRAIFPVHYGGVACDMDRITAIAQDYNLMVVEDAAQGVNAFYKQRALGTIGHLGAYSFHSTKNYTCGEGGALCINSPEMVERAEIIREKGTNRSKFLRGEIHRYTWVDVGSSYVPSEIVCAFLYAQLEMLGRITERRRKVFQFYHHYLLPFEEQGLVRLPFIPQGCDSNYHIYSILLADVRTRDALIAYLNRNGVAAVSHYVPLHSSPMGLRLGYQQGDLPITEELSGRLVRLPLFPDLTEEEQLKVVNHLSMFFNGMKNDERTPDLILVGLRA